MEILLGRGFADAGAESLDVLDLALERAGQIQVFADASERGAVDTALEIMRWWMISREPEDKLTTVNDWVRLNQCNQIVRSRFSHTKITFVGSTFVGDPSRTLA